MRTGAIFLSVIVVFNVMIVSIEGGIVVSHPPDQSGATLSDTDWFPGGPSTYSQELADDFILDTAATIRRVIWWGGGSGIAQATSETFGIRFYGTNSTNGFPGDLLLNSTILNPSRQATGLRIVGAGRVTAEYVYEVDLATPVSLDANTSYWLEIVQIGDPDSGFEWEVSSASPNSFAFQYPSGAQWQWASSSKSLAFELSMIPEPGTLALAAFGFALARSRTRRHARQVS